MKVFSLVIFGFLWASSVALSGQILDQLVLEVNKLSYTQRQFEIHMAIRTALLTEPSEQLRLVSKDNWRQLLERYRNDMIVDQEALRLSSMQQPADQLESFRLAIEDRKRSDIIFSSFLSKMGTDSDEISR